MREISKEKTIIERVWKDYSEKDVDGKMKEALRILCERIKNLDKYCGTSKDGCMHIYRKHFREFKKVEGIK